ncbi:coiled-coil domain-containing protein [Nocardia jiangxiensis]|uniref:coiled-coil domain-containing protein n=1 Tax=Nocardia jiangxiensis TaxID=282685 RepID=UPI000300F525|nr:hypothetical protein [Nocardia jiangxiensis]
MSLLYRAIWIDSAPDVPEIGLDRLRSWIKHKTAGSIVVPDEGAVTGAVVVPARSPGEPEQRYEADLRIDRASGTEVVPKALSATFTELRADGTRWDTTLRTWTETHGNGELGWLWVDVECVGLGDHDNVPIAAPRLAVDLIRYGASPIRGPVLLSSMPKAVVGAEAGTRLAELILAPERDIPVVVFSSGGERLAKMPPTHTFEQITQKAADRLAGIAVIYIADDAGCAALTARLGENYGIWGGAFRIYLPGLDLEASSEYLRHRYVRTDRYIRFRDLAANIISRTVGPISSARRPPDSYYTARDMLRMSKSSDWELLARILEEQNDNLAARNASITEDLSHAEEKYMNLVIDLEDSFKEREDLATQLATAQQQIRAQNELLRRNGIADDSWDVHLESDAIPDSADNLSEAAAQAQLYLSDRLVLPEAALRDLDELDATIESKAWGQTAWRGLRALHAYAVDQSNGVCLGSFWDWCAGSMNPLAWPATAKKLSMRESYTVEGNAALRGARVLPVSTTVSRDGEVYMPAHLKISTGGGNLAPRIYFHWDPTESKIHIGFFGPHKYLPNSKT